MSRLVHENFEIGDFSILQNEWEDVRVQLQEQVGDSVYQNWLAPLTLASLRGPVLELAAPTRFMRDWVMTNYGLLLKEVWNDRSPSIHYVDVIAAADRPPAHAILEQTETPTNLAGATTIPSQPHALSAVSPAATTQSPPSQRSEPQSSQSRETGESGDFADLERDGNIIGAALDPRFTFENFIVGKPNELAYAAALRVAESHIPQFNPLFLYGGVGLGKTHLMHAIAWHIRTTHPERRVIYLSAEKFMYQFIRALRYKDTVAFKEMFRSVDVLMIDDVQFISGKDSTQEEFFHTFNALVDRNHQIIISADKSPSDLEGMEERLKSRLGWGLVADIHPTSYELRLGILQAKADSLKTHVPKEVIEFLAYKIVSNVRELEGALNRIIAHSTLVGREITLDVTQEVLRDLLKANDRRLTIDDIQKRVCDYFNIKMTDMQSPKRTQNVARPRQVAMYLSKMLTSRSFPEIGRKFGGRDHTTVLHAVKKIEELMEQDREFCEDLTILRRTLER